MENHKPAIRIITFGMIQGCPMHIMSAEHWIPYHHVEECNPELREKLKNFDEDYYEPTKRLRLEEVREQLAKEREIFIEKLRHEAEG